MILFLSVARAWAFNPHQPFDISADILDYTDANQLITAEGHVIVVQSSSTLTSDSLVFDRQNQHLLAHGHVVLRENGATLAGDQMDYDLLTQKGSFENALGYQAPWLFRGADWEKQKDYYVGRQVSFTSCDLIDPHYHIRASRIHLIPDDRFWSWNNLVYADTLPIFYSPFLYKNLGKQRVVVQIQPGHDDVNGNFFKTITTMRYTDNVYQKVYLDHYTEIGTGFGSELDYHPSSKMKGSLFGYYINPSGNPELAGAPQAPQYNFRTYHWQSLSPTLTLQSDANLRQNVSFNNQYFPQDTNQSVTDVNSSIALTHQTKRINEHLVIEELNAPDTGDTSTFAATHVQTASLPRYDFTLFQTPLLSPATGQHHLFGPLLFSMNGSAGESYSRLDDRTRFKGSDQMLFSESIPLSRQWTFNPSAGPQLNFQDKFDPAQTIITTTTATGVPMLTLQAPPGAYRGFQGRMGTSDTLRWRPTSAFTLDNTYTLTDRLQPNGVGIDRSQTDGGVEAHHLSWLAYIRPSRRVLVRSFSGMDFRNIADEDPNVYLQRKWDPWTTELTLDPTRRVEFFSRYQLGYYPTRDLSWEQSVNYTGIYKTIIGTGLLYSKGTPGQMTWNNSLGFYAGPSWRVDAILNSLLPSVNGGGGTPANLIDSEFIVTRDLHCATAQFVYRNRPPFSREYSLLFNLKFTTDAANEISNQDLESQFYPWRARPYAP